MSKSTMTAPSILFSPVRYGRICSEWKRPVPVHDLALLRLHGLDRLEHLGLELRRVEARPQIAERAADVPADQAEKPLGGRREAAQPQVGPHDHQRRG